MKRKTFNIPIFQYFLLKLDFSNHKCIESHGGKPEHTEQNDNDPACCRLPYNFSVPSPVLHIHYVTSSSLQLCALGILIVFVLQ